ncbi:DUF2642 domain-containing protein [Alicyclobacillus fastidiosus]|uniref:DUF2642 domain-containing protein n=1 Tax=Alicyclobacillus fastidiosus TaxID=392011 RepID=A0ABV5AAW5_9BACL|nr:DUF2642 domain-containing protein [Alicyclobacillus fastidiosus]WEH11833.1 DUF2642 domain-containing protein [Alicyclobacillus fastidiosus]
MARFRLPGNTTSERVQQLVNAIQEGVANASTNASANFNMGSANSILRTLESLLPSLANLPTAPAEPLTLRQALLRLLNENVVITTPFEPVTGTLIAVEDDYVAVVEPTSNLVLIPIRKIESATTA